MERYNELVKRRAIEFCDLLINEELSHQEVVRIAEILKVLMGMIDYQPPTCEELLAMTQDRPHPISEIFGEVVEH